MRSAAWETSSVMMLAIALLLLACGKDVDLGGTTSDAADDAADAGDEGNDVCEPCTAAEECRAGAACVRVGTGDTYCETACPSGAECESDETCSSLATAEKQTTRACSPTANACPVAVSPTGADGGTLDHCGDLTGPKIASECHTCEYDCQANGCYAGWWCNTSTRHCERPPTSCP